jgi:hypothetical protein
MDHLPHDRFHGRRSSQATTSRESSVTMLSLIDRLTHSSLFCFCVWLAFALWAWSFLDEKGHKQLMIGGAVSIVIGLVRLIASSATRAR